jgi:PAS domain S-box-containing protein
MELQSRLAAIIESSDDAIVGQDLEGIIRSWNRGAERLFGYQPEEAIGRHVSMLAAPDRLDEVPGLLERIRQGKRVEHYETKRRTKDGRILTVSLSVSPIREASGRVVGISKIARDITEQEASYRALRETNEALSRANADLEQFAFAVSHDLQEPVRNILIYAQLLERRAAEQLSEEAEGLLNTLATGARRIEALIRDLLVYTQASREGAEAEQAVQASAVWLDAVESHSALIEETGASITSDRLPAVRMQAGHLRQVFGNLLSNGLKYRSGKPPRMHLSVKRTGAQWLFSLEDNGIGIDPAFFRQIFGVFKRLHSAESYPGTGMGLAICERIVQRYGGQIWVDSALGSGSVFHFTVPAE